MSVQESIAELELSFEKLHVHVDQQLIMQLGRLLLPTIKFPISDKNVNQILRKAETRNFREACLLVEQDPLLSWRILCTGANTWELARQNELDLQRIAMRLLSNDLEQAFDQVGPIASLQDFFRGRGIAWHGFQMQLLACSLAEEIFVEMVGENQTMSMRISGILAYLQEIAATLIAYVRPHWAARCALDGVRTFDETFQRNLRKLFRKSLYAVSAEICSLAEGPEFISDLIGACDVAPWNRRTWVVNNDRNFHEAASAAFVANRLVQRMAGLCTALTFAQDLDLYNNKLKFKDGQLRAACSRSMARHVFRCGCLGIPLPHIPQALEKYFVETDETGKPISMAGLPNPDQALQYLWELKACLRTVPAPRDMQRLPQAIYTTLLGLTHGLGFAKACFFIVDEQTRSISPYCLFGRNLPEEVSTRRNLAEESNMEYVDVQAIYRADFLSRGTPLAEDDWPFIAFPALSGKRAFGVFYAAHHSKAMDGLNSREEMTCLAFAEEWRDVAGKFFERSLTSSTPGDS